ncbi:DUF2871 family protein [Rhodocytophaga rosea]|uniref:DUF2871 family protein n=1 Tax=Rhodocytophaga rosea TaxID=2704465 RepID=A0A6C0GT87_9BACT|nr:DUF2871 family protein [Rhodocytophaga rosea]QHT71381.1 DUF2871 family protein [Rhodocytophaga rosea]
MYYTLFLTIHSILRWLVLSSIVYATISALQGLVSKRMYSKSDSIIRSLATTLTHTQLLLGFVLYFILSPITGQFMKGNANGNEQMWFFGAYHIALMFIAVGVMTTGGSKAKRATTDRDKFRFTAISFGISLLLILLAIPWFRPFFRGT